MSFIFLCLILLSFFGFFGCLIWLVVSFFTKTPKKFPIISLLASVVVFFISAPTFAHLAEKTTSPVTEGTTSKSSGSTDDPEVTKDDLEITADDENTYSNRIEFETDEDGVAHIEATTAEDAEIVLTPKSTDSEKQRTESDESGNFNFEVEVSDTSQEEYDLQAAHNEKLGEKLEVHVRNDYYEDDTDTKEDENDNVDLSEYDTGITYDDLARNPDDNKFENVTLSGTIIQVLEGSSSSQYRLAVDDNYDNIVLIDIPEKLLDSRVLEDDILTIYGESEGTVDYESTMGGNITVPFVSVDKFETNGQAE
ncbi:hypothetical protein [Tetragenococcus halophilus]|uniref:hypothetical protein n=1 Tax=Tetragenococcus halophilus TaxID=51669 RepID=UPI00077C9DE8|nr:hypothetical protein [Tetragenococcus halophilus]